MKKIVLFILIHVQALLTTMNNDYSHLEFNKVCNKHEGGVMKKIKNLVPTVKPVLSETYIF